MSRRPIRLLAAAALSLGLTVPMAGNAAESIEVPDHDFSFDGIFGTFNRDQLQRGFQVYREVCAACHGLRLISFRNLGDGPAAGNNSGGLGYGEDEVKAFAAEYTIDHLGLDPELRDQVDFGYFESGHMMYIHEPSRALLKRQVADFYAQ